MAERAATTVNFNNPPPRNNNNEYTEYARTKSRDPYIRHLIRKNIRNEYAQRRGVNQNYLNNLIRRRDATKVNLTKAIMEERAETTRLRNDHKKAIETWARAAVQLNSFPPTNRQYNAYKKFRQYYISELNKAIRYQVVNERKYRTIGAKLSGLGYKLGSTITNFGKERKANLTRLRKLKEGAGILGRRIGLGLRSRGKIPAQIFSRTTPARSLFNLELKEQALSKKVQNLKNKRDLRTQIRTIQNNLKNYNRTWNTNAATLENLKRTLENVTRRQAEAKRKVERTNTRLIQLGQTVAEAEAANAVPPP